MKDTVFTLASLLKEKKISSVELTKAYIHAIEKENSALNAYVSFNFEEALKQAEAADRMLAQGACSPLCGIPMTLKDNICAKGVPTTCASRILQDYKPVYDATAWSKLRALGAVMLGKTNMDEFAMGSTCETSCYGATKNPRDPAKVPGGSSGGGAAAVCANLAPYALGSDTGGSIRQPASFCGIVGLKPTYGAVSRYGLVAYGSSLDQIGPLTTSVRDAALVFDAIKGKDPFDDTSRAVDLSPTLLKEDVRGVKVGVIREYFDGLGEEISSAIGKTIAFLQENGAEIISLSLPEIKLALPVYYIIACAEASSNLGRYDGIRYGYRVENYTTLDDMISKVRSEGFGKEVKRRIMLGSYVLSSGYYDAYYKKARKLRSQLAADLNKAFCSCDVLIAPTTASTAFPLNNPTKSVTETYLTDIYTVPVNVAGLPAVSLPCGKDRSGMPIGLQFIGGKFEEGKILSAARFLEEHFDCGIEEYEGGVRL